MRKYAVFFVVTLVLAVAGYFYITAGQSKYDKKEEVKKISMRIEVTSGNGTAQVRYFTLETGQQAQGIFATPWEKSVLSPYAKVNAIALNGSDVRCAIKDPYSGKILVKDGPDHAVVCEYGDK